MNSIDHILASSFSPDKIQAEQDAALLQVIDNMDRGVMLLDDDLTVVLANVTYTRITGIERDEIVGANLRDHLPSSVFADPTKIIRQIASSDFWENEFWTKRLENEDYCQKLTVWKMNQGPRRGPARYVATIADVTARRRAEQFSQHHMSHDPLTGLANRAMSIEILEKAIANAQRSAQKVVLFLIGIDGFKLVNETFGHRHGDVLLAQASERIQACVRKGDSVARMGGDEFAVIMPNVKTLEHSEIAARRIIEDFNRPFDVNGQEIPLSVSIGIASFPADGQDPYDLTRAADVAMFNAKANGRATFRTFSADLTEHVTRRMLLKTGLGKALARHEFKIQYQPKLDLATGMVKSVEALLRWNSTDLGSVPPDIFIPVLEDSGLLNEVGAWVMRDACRQHNAWISDGLPPIQIAVNLSARQIHDTGFIDLIKRIVAESKVDPSFLQIEITENTLMSNVAQSVRTLTALRDMGFGVSMDDFGTGYSSLSYLKAFPIDELKIDRAFIRDIDRNPQDAEIVRTIVALGQTLEMRVVAEGVETSGQLTVLRRCNCDQIQGYIFSRPIFPENLGGFLKSTAKTFVATHRIGR